MNRQLRNLDRKDYQNLHNIGTTSTEIEWNMSKHDMSMMSETALVNGDALDVHADDRQFVDNGDQGVDPGVLARLQKKAGGDGNAGETADNPDDDDVEELLNQAAQRQKLLEQQLLNKQKRLKLEQINRQNRELESEIQRVSEESAAEMQKSSVAAPNAGFGTHPTHGSSQQSHAGGVPKSRVRRGKKSAGPERGPFAVAPGRENDSLTVRSLRASDVLQTGAEQLLQGFGLPGGETSVGNSGDSIGDKFDPAEAALVKNTREYASKQKMSRKGYVRGTNHNGSLQSGPCCNQNPPKQMSRGVCNLENLSNQRHDCSVKFEIVTEFSSSEDEFSNSERIRKGLLKQSARANNRQPNVMGAGPSSDCGCEKQTSKRGQKDKQNELKWPNEHLGARYNNFGKSGVAYKQLDLRLLVAGELNIALSGDVSENERLARLQLIEDVVFDSAYYQWSAVLRFHAAVLSEVQRGALVWGQSYARLEQQMLMPFPMIKTRTSTDKKVESGETGSSRSANFTKNTNKGSNRDDKVYYCGDWQGGACAQTGHHRGLLFGQSVKMQHVCSACLQLDSKRVNHPASSTECPHHEVV